jgi:hypothetical protein
MLQRVTHVRILGSCLHALIALKDPRWEDFNYERVDGSRNRLRWLGNGMTHNEQFMTGDSKSTLIKTARFLSFS